MCFRIGDGYRWFVVSVLYPLHVLGYLWCQRMCWYDVMTWFLFVFIFCTLCMITILSKQPTMFLFVWNKTNRSKHSKGFRSNKTVEKHCRTHLHLPDRSRTTWSQSDSCTNCGRFRAHSASISRFLSIAWQISASSWSSSTSTSANLSVSMSASSAASSAFSSTLADRPLQATNDDVVETTASEQASDEVAFCLSSCTAAKIQ